MTQTESDFEEVIGTVEEFGCPICGDVPSSARILFVSTFELNPCGHVVIPEDVTHMKEFYRELWFEDIHNQPQ